jgi:hypothetical protein
MKILCGRERGLQDKIESVVWGIGAQLGLLEKPQISSGEEATWRIAVYGHLHI